MTPIAMPALAPGLKGEEATVLLEDAVEGVLVPVAVADAVAAVPVPVGVFDGVITEGKSLVAVALFVEVDDDTVDFCDVEVVLDDVAAAASSLIMK